MNRTGEEIPTIAEVRQALFQLRHLLDDKASHALDRVLATRHSHVELQAALRFEPALKPLREGRAGPNVPSSLGPRAEEGAAALERFRRSRSRTALDSAVQAFDEVCSAEASGAVPAGDRAWAAEQADEAHRLRYGLTHALMELEKAVLSARNASKLSRPGSSRRAIRISNLGNRLLALYTHTGDEAYLGEAMRSYEEGAATFVDDDPDRGGPLTGIGIVYKCRAERYGSADDAAASVAAAEAALAAYPPQSEQRPACALNLASSLLTLFQLRSEEAVLQRLIAATHDALTVLPRGVDAREQLGGPVASAIETWAMRIGSETHRTMAREIRDLLADGGA